jgi:hypothetical protein
MITFLGNVIDSVSMTVTLPKEKVDALKMNVYVYKRKMEYQQSIASHQYIPHFYAHTDVM